MTASQDQPRSSSAEHHGQTVITDAARLALRCAGFLVDRQAAKEDWTIFYAVDADIIKLYLAPDANAHYARVFEPYIVAQIDPEDHTQGLLARLLGDFIFREFTGAAGGAGPKLASLLIIPPHDIEYKRLIFRLGSAFDSSGLSAEKQLAKAIEKLRDTPADDDDFPEWLLKNAPQLIEVLDRRSGPAKELERFKALDESRLLNIERYREESDGWKFPLHRLGSAEDFDRAVEDRKRWSQDLFKNRSDTQTDRAIENDIEVMTRLEWVNRSMCASKRKLVLITGTTSILEAAQDYYPPGLGSPGQSFADLYVRHPQAFMADPSFFEGATLEREGATLEREEATHVTLNLLERKETTDVTFDLLEWLNLIFPHALQNFDGHTVINTERLKQIRRSPGRRYDKGLNTLARSERLKADQPGFVKSVLGEWSKVIGGAGLAHKIDNPTWLDRAREVYEFLRSRIERGASNEDLHFLLTELVVRAWNSLYLSSSCLNLWSSLEVQPATARGIPVLRFAPLYEEAQSYCTTLVNTLRGDQAKSPGTDARESVEIVTMYQHLARADDSHYHGHVVHALAYATKGDWYATRTLCRLALRTIDMLRRSQKPDPRTGREASYLLALTERRLARRKEDLSIARMWLREAERRHKKEIAPVPSPGPDPRFASEGLAQEIAEINFKVFVEYEPFGRKPESLTKVSKLFDRASALLASDELKYDNQEDVRRWVYQQVLTNVLDLALVVRITRTRPAPKPLLQQIHGFIAIAKKQHHDNSAEYDLVAEFVFHVAMAVFQPLAEERKASARQALDIDFPVHRPFDKAREKAFKSLAEEALKGDDRPRKPPRAL